MNRKLPTGIISIIVIILLIGLFLITSNLNNTQNVEDEGKAKIIISLNFGEKILKEVMVKSGISVIDALKSVANVSLAYGGKFVVSIDNISSDLKEQRDWFYYVNGFLANVGAADYIIHPGDVVRWDYHCWKTLLVNSELQDFPYMFTKGYSNKTYPLVVVYEPTFRNEAEKIYNFMKKSMTVNIVKIENLTREILERNNVILLGKSSKLVEEINSRYDELGWKYHLSGDYVVDIHGKKYRGAFAQITQSPYNSKGIGACENILLLIAGNEEYVGTVVDILLNYKIDSFWVMEGEPL